MHVTGRGHLAKGTRHASIGSSSSTAPTSMTSTGQIVQVMRALVIQLVCVAVRGMLVVGRAGSAQIVPEEPRGRQGPSPAGAQSWLRCLDRTAALRPSSPLPECLLAGARKAKSRTLRFHKATSMPSTGSSSSSK